MPKASILIVEDEQVVALDLRSSLETAGYRVVGQTGRGEDALRQAAALQPDLVLMDIGLRGDMDGTEAASQIRAELHLPVIFLTAFADEATLRRARPAEHDRGRCRIRRSNRDRTRDCPTGPVR